MCRTETVNGRPDSILWESQVMIHSLVITSPNRRSRRAAGGSAGMAPAGDAGHAGRRRRRHATELCHHDPGVARVPPGRALACFPVAHCRHGADPSAVHLALAMLQVGVSLDKASAVWDSQWRGWCCSIPRCVMQHTRFCIPCIFGSQQALTALCAM